MEMGNLRMRAMPKLPVVPICRSPFILICRMSLDAYRKSEVWSAPFRARSRGALRDRHERWARDAMDALVTRAIIRTDERHRSGRKSVWSWPPDAEAKLAR
jgi:hypothetical protein